MRMLHRVPLLRSWTRRGFHTARSVCITRNNFPNLLERVLRHIREADFLAIDTRITGTSNAPWRKLHPLDTCDTAYHKLKHSAERFAMLEFGLCTFTWRKSQFIAKPFNFYLFPQDDLKVKIDGECFLCDTKNLENMAKFGFDFNTCIQHGLSHISRDQELMAGVKMDFEGEDYVGVQMFGKFRQWCTRDSEMTVADKLFSQHIRNKILEWYKTEISSRYYDHGCRSSSDDDCKNVQADSKLNNKVHQKSINSRIIWRKSCETPHLLRTSMKWESLGNQEILVLLQVIQHEFSDLIAVVQPENPTSRTKNVHVFYSGSERDTACLLEELERGESKEKERQLIETIGFRHIIDCIVETKKVIVGHHCILDFLHIFKCFFKPLPLNPSKFSSMLQESFPCIMDTKYLLNEILHLKNSNNTSLHYLFSKLCSNYDGNISKVVIEFSDGLQPNRGDSKENERQTNIRDSGIKAYMAGCLFAYICDVTKTDPSELKQFVNGNCKAEIKRYVNLLYFNTTVSSVLDLSTGCEVRTVASLQNQLQNRNVLLIWGYVIGTTPSLIQSAINETVNVNSSVNVYPLDDSSALAEFFDAEIMEQFLVKTQDHGKLEDQEMLVAGLRAARFPTYEFLCKYAPSVQRLADCAKQMKLGSHVS